MSVLHVKAATHNADPTTVGTPDDDTDPYGIQGALDNVSDGDIIRLWDDADYNIGTQIDVDDAGTSGPGSAGSPVTVQGANSSGVVDGTRATLKATASITAIFKMDDSELEFYRFEHLELDGNSNSTYCVDYTDFDTSYTILWYNCSFHGATSHGIRPRVKFWAFVKCEIYGNGGSGIYAQFAEAPRCIACAIHDNASHGIYCVGALCEQIIDCLIYDNGADGVHHNAASAITGVVRGNTIHGNTAAGLSINNGGASFAMTAVVANNAFVSNGTYGLELSGAAWEGATIDYNNYYGNGTAACDESTPGSNNQTGDPDFASVVDGSEDFTPGGGDALDGNGMAPASNVATTIGAAIAADPAGGSGGGLKLVGCGGLAG